MTRSIDLVRDLATDTFAIPDGSMPVGTATVAGEPRTLLVSFPPGWQRESAGHYLASEEFVVLAGAIAVSDDVHGPGSWVHVPARTLRDGTRTPEGALALAWFEGSATWVTDQPSTSVPTTHVDLARAGRATGSSPFGPGRTLRRRRAWWVTELDRDGPDDVIRQVLAPGTSSSPPRLFTVPAGSRLPAVEGACLVRSAEEC